jgi:hypothetical protein
MSKFYTFETPMLTARGILVSCAIPAFFFALFNVLFLLSGSILQAFSAAVATFFEVKKIEIIGAELTLTSQGVAFVTIALLWGLFVWLAKFQILSPYSRPKDSELGTVLELFETFPKAQCGLDPSPVWHRLVYVIPENYLELIDSNNIFLYFFLNLSVSAYVFAGEAFIASIWLGSISLAALGILSLAFGYGFYRVSLPIVRLRSVYLQSCFDLFRMDF